MLFVFAFDIDLFVSSGLAPPVQVKNRLTNAVNAGMVVAYTKGFTHEFSSTRTRTNPVNAN